MVRSFAEYHPHSLSPVLVNAHKGPRDLRRDVAQDGVGRRMYMQRGSDQKKKRRLGRQLSPAKISKFQELTSRVVPLHPRPIVESLQRKMNVLVGFQLDDGKPSLVRKSQH